MMVKVMYNDKLVYNVVIRVFLWDKFMKREGSFKMLEGTILSIYPICIRE